MKLNKIIFVVPVYNEILNVNKLVDNLVLTLKKYSIQDYKIIFGDDNSNDGTFEYLENLRKANNSIEVLRFGETNKGPGFIFKNIFIHILSNKLLYEKYNILISVEADNTSDISIINQMIALHDFNYDICLSSPYSFSGGLINTQLYRKFLSYFGNILIKNTLKLNGINTVSSFFRSYSIPFLKKNLQNIDLNKTENGFNWVIEILFLLNKNSMKLIEIPCHLKSDNRVGKSKMKILNNILSYLKLILKLKIL